MICYIIVLGRSHTGGAGLVLLCDQKKRQKKTSVTTAVTTVIQNQSQDKVEELW